MALGDPLISDERLAEIRLRLSNGFGMRHHEIEAVFGEIARLKRHNAYLTDLFYGITHFFGHLCERHAAVPLEERDLSRMVVPACLGCQEDDLRALVAGNPGATTLARGYREAHARNLLLMIENRRLRERLGEGDA